LNAIRILLSLLLATALLQGCGSSGGGGGSSAPAVTSIRLVNATAAYPKLDLSASGVALASAIASGAASAYANIAAGNQTYSAAVSGSGTSSALATFNLASGVGYALVARVEAGQLQISPLTEYEAAPAAGDGKIRIANLATKDTGFVDVYLTGSTGTLSSASALVTNSFGVSAYTELPAGTYQIWVTGAGNKSDVRLYLPSVAISSLQVLTIALTATTGGVLVDGWLITQQGAVASQINANARVRVAANVTGGTVAATANGVLLNASSLVSPAVDTYVSVPAGPLTTNVLVNGTSVPVPGLNAAAGADYTLLAAGSAAAPRFFLLADDNRLPSPGAAKLRLVNGVNGLAGTLTLSSDANLIAQNVAFGAASSAGTIATTGNISQLQVFAQGSASPQFGPSILTLLSQGVYSVFMLGANTSSPLVGIVRADR
jgi:hypothetical protein